MSSYYPTLSQSQRFMELNMNGLIDNMEYIGMFSMGAFVAGVLNYGLTLIKDADSFSKVATSVFGAAFSGVVFIFLQFMVLEQDGANKVINRAIFMYPIGLILSLLWLQIEMTIDKRIKAKGEGSLRLQIIGWLHLIGLILLTFALVLKLLFGSKIA